MIAIHGKGWSDCLRECGESVYVCACMCGAGGGEGVAYKLIVRVPVIPLVLDVSIGSEAITSHDNNRNEDYMAHTHDVHYNNYSNC